MVVLSSKGHSKGFKMVCDEVEVQVHLNGENTIRNLFMAPNDKDNIIQKSGVIYRFRCVQAECEEDYIGESGRSFGDRLKEHLSSLPHIGPWKQLRIWHQSE